jgi:hypothetical protein
MDHTRHQQLIDQLQAALPLLGRVRVTSQQQAADVAAALAALERAVALLRTPAPMLPASTARRTPDLRLALLRSGHAVPEVAFLAGIPEARLRNLLSGDAPTREECSALGRVLSEWNPNGTREKEA